MQAMRADLVQKKFKSGGSERVAFALLESNPAAATHGLDVVAKRRSGDASQL
jgi:hypothetical protein